MKGILGFTEDDVVSTDFVGDSRYILGSIYSKRGTLIIEVHLFNVKLLGAGQAFSMPRLELP